MGRKKSFDLNADTYLFGTVVDSRVSRPVLVEGRPQPLYTITVAFTDPGDAFSLGLLYDAHMGPYCLNREEVVEELMNSKTITFESIIKPIVSGQNLDTNEFQTGANVRVSCRFEMRTGEIGVNNDGEFQFPDFVLRFVDAEWSEEKEATEAIPEPDPETLTYYEF